MDVSRPHAAPRSSRLARGSLVEGVHGMIVLHELSKEWNGHQVLDALSLTIFAAEKVALLGRRGSGKSTLMQILCGYLRPSTGSVQIGTYDLGHQSSQARRLIGYIPTHPPLYPELSVSEYLRLCAALRGARPADKVAHAALEACDLASFRHDIIRNLSRGVQQRINFAQALLHDPAFLLIDDPFVDLDPAERDSLLNILLGFGPQKTMLLATHSLELLARLCNRTIILHQGRVSFDGELKELKRFHQLEAAFLHYTPEEEALRERNDGPLEA
jgi:ABC-2 type transport system ATP-binding protein